MLSRQYADLHGDRIWMVPGTYSCITGYANFECNQGHQWSAIVYNISRKSGCRQCYNEFMRNYKKDK
jgi:hypothetical protein